VAPKSASFKSALSSFGNNTGIEVPADLIEKLGAGKRPAVIVNVNGYEYRSTVGVMGGKHLISVSAAVRKETGLEGGDPIRVKLTIADEPGTVDAPPDFAAAMKASKGTRAFFDSLSNSLQRYHVDNINGTRNAETRKRRIEKAVSLFSAGKQR
jgi:Bacteriocin-protection, YdeI or OmpD-Associated/Domain of unknown function (DUF1905)